MTNLYQKEIDEFIKEWGWTKEQQHGFLRWFNLCDYCGEETVRFYKRNVATCYECKKKARIERFKK